MHSLVFNTSSSPLVPEQTHLMSHRPTFIVTQIMYVKNKLIHLQSIVTSLVLEVQESCSILSKGLTLSTSNV